VIKISLPYIYSLAEALEPLNRLQHDTSMQVAWSALWNAKFNIQSLIQNSVFASTLRSCQKSAHDLMSFIDTKITNTSDINANTLDVLFILTLNNLVTNFKTAMLAEMGVLPSYFVSQKESFDTNVLLDEGEKIFPASLKEKVPEAVFDVAEAGKALAYELPTSAGFHIFRATESVIRRYYLHVTNGKALPRVRNIGVYIRGIRADNAGDEKILASLEQMTKLHRNPLIHPEAVLTLDEAIATLGIARSVVTAMLAALPIQALTTGSP
jgi:hypothetical protein